MSIECLADLKFLTIIERCRKNLINDTLNKSSDLFNALYDNINSEIYKIELELYELKWLESHWLMLCNCITQEKFSRDEQKKLITFLAEKYKVFVEGWNYSQFDSEILEEKIELLEKIILTNQEWNQYLNNINVSFKKSKKNLENKIQLLKEEAL